MPFLDSNIPSKIFYASVGSEILRIARTTSNLHDLVTRVNALLTRMAKQGSKHKQIASLINKLFGRHFNVFKKFADTANQFIRLLNL